MKEFEQKIAQAQQERKDKAKSTEIRLGMFASDALENGQLEPLVDSFFGKRAGWLGFYTNPERQEVEEREKRLKERYIRGHPGLTDEEYSTYRNDQLQKFTRRARGGINRRFNEAVSLRFDVERAPNDFAAKRMLDAGRIMERIADTLYPENPSLHPRNETVLLPVTAAKIVEQVTSDDVGEHLKREQIQRLIHAFVAAEDKRINGKLEAEKKISQIQYILATKLFETPQGDLIDKEICMVIDDVTNEVLFIDGIDGDIGSYVLTKGMHIKKLPTSMRRVAGSGYLVLTNPDTKRIESSEPKAISRAKKRFENNTGDVVRVVEDVHDRHRILFTVFGDEFKRDDFKNQLVELLLHPDNQRFLGDLDENDDISLDEHGLIKGRVLSVVEDSETNGYRTQAGVVFKRVQVYVDGLHSPIEIKIQTMKDSLMDEWHIGNRDPQTGLYNGRAHRLYELRRAAEVREYYSPEEITGERFDLDAEILATQEKVIFELFSHTR